MRPEAPLPTHPPFLTLYTPTFRRPEALARCLQSVGEQTAAGDLEQIVLPDHVRYGVGPGLYGRVKWLAPAFRGRYVNFLCDDDVLPDTRAVEHLRDFADRLGEPEVIVTRVLKNGLLLPICDPTGEPVQGECDLTSFVVRRDVWLAHLGDYTQRYEGDYDHAHAMWRAGRRFEFCDLLWAVGGALNGRPEY